jgi:ribosome-binding protein aMBF1 (putative translation factor)
MRHEVGIKKKCDVAVVSGGEPEAFIPTEDTDVWQKMERNRLGNPLAGARLKAGLTQAALARKIGIRQNMVGDYERGRRRLSPAMARRFSRVLGIKPDRLVRSKDRKPVGGESDEHA